MAYREVGMIEVKEVLRQWLLGTSKKRIARQVGADVKTVRRYVRVAEEAGLCWSNGVQALTDEAVSRVLEKLKGGVEREHGASWEACREQRGRIEELLTEGVRLSKIGRLLRRGGVEIPYATLHRYAVAELGFGKGQRTIAVIEGEAGKEVQVDTGWIGWIWGEDGSRRRLKAWIFTAVRSRHRFVYPTMQETTAEAIAACEAAWTFYGGVFGVLLPDNTKAIVEKADPLDARIQTVFLEYSQARGFVVDPARVRHPKDKARVERSVAHVRDDCFGGERLKTLEEARRHAEAWCLEYGGRVHSRTQRRPLELFLEQEKERLLPEPQQAYDVPRWSSATVERDQYIPVSRGLYSVPTAYVGHKLTARADKHTVRFYEGGVLVKVHVPVGPGERATDPNDFPEAKRIYAHRDVEALEQKAQELGEHVGLMAAAILSGKLPWTRMRRVYALLGLGRRYGPERLEEACRTALEADMTDVVRLRQMLERATISQDPPPRATVVSIARYLRPTDHFAVRREV